MKIIKNIGNKNEFKTFIELAQKYKSFKFKDKKSDEFASLDEMWSLMQKQKQTLYNEFGKISKVPIVTEIYKREKIYYTVVENIAEIYGKKIKKIPTIEELTNNIENLADILQNELKKFDYFNSYLIKQMKTKESANKLYISPSPLPILYAAYRGKASYAPGDEYEHMPFVFAAVSTLMVAFDSNFKWSAYILVFPAAKRFKILAANTKESIRKHLSVVEYMRQKGYREIWKIHTFEDFNCDIDEANEFFNYETELEEFTLDEELPFCILSGYRNKIHPMTDAYFCRECYELAFAHETGSKELCAKCIERSKKK